MAPAGAVSKPFAAEELSNASLLCERGDLLIKHHERLREAEGCFKKALAIARRFPDDERASDLCFTCNLGIAHIGTIRWIASKSSPHKTSRAAETARELLKADAVPASRPVTGMGLSTRASARHRAASAQPTAPEPETDATGWVPYSSRAQGETAREHPADAGSKGLSKEKKALSIEQATAMQSTQKTQARASPYARGGESVWGVNGTEGISPEASLAMQRAKLTHSWGPKPAAVHRSCQMREGNVTKRIRMDRDRLTRNANVSQQEHADRPKPAAYFKPIPLSVLQTNKGLAGMPLQRSYAGTRALSTEPYGGMGAVHAMGVWAQRQGQQMVGGGGAAFLPQR